MPEGQSSRPVANVDTKMMYLIRRRPEASREELIAHWFANHMPDVVRQQQLQASAGKLAASRYIATLFDEDASGRSHWDGVAQLWFAKPLPPPAQPMGTRPADSFQEKAEPYLPWATTEYVALDGELPVTPLTLNAPFPTTRSGFCKVTFLVKTQPTVDYDALYAHWLDIHVPNVIDTMRKTGGFHYLVSHSLTPQSAPYAGMAELYFPDHAAWQEFLQTLPRDGIDQYIEQLEIRTSSTEMIGIP